MGKYSNEELLKGILKNNSIILRFIYQNYFGSVHAYILKNQGQESDANDIFQEAIIVIYRKLKEDNLILKDCTFETYLISICRFLWLKQLRTRRNNIIQPDDLEKYEEVANDSEFVEIAAKNEKYKLYQEHFQKLGRDCQKLLNLFLDKIPLKKVTEMLGYNSLSYTKKRKHQCKEYLVESIKQDIRFKTLIDND